MKRVAFPCLVIVLLISSASAVRGESIEWIRQLGTSDDESYGASADGLGSVYISGYTYGSLGGPNAGASDAFVNKYDATGTLQWSRQLGTSTRDESYGVSADGLGNVYISGYTYGSLGGPTAGGVIDAFVSKYDAAGTLQWTRQLGTSSNDESLSVSADGLGNVYISGWTGGSLGLGGPTAGGIDAFVSKYDAAGTLQWTRQLGTTTGDWSRGVSADGLGSVYISGYTYGSLGGPNAGLVDAFVSKYDAAGTLQWSRQLGTSSEDQSTGVSADGLGNVYISGYTFGSLGGPTAGSGDAFVSKYDAAGTLQWTRQLGTSAADISNGVSADGPGNVYISGLTNGSLGGPNAGAGPFPHDAFVSKYDAAGTLQWTRQLGTSTDDWSQGVSADGLGNVYISGYTDGSLGGPNAGGLNAFVAKIADVPEPTSILLFALATVPICLARKRFRSSPHLLAAALLFSIELAPHSAIAVTIDTVPIGNPGNAPDTRYIDFFHPNGVGAVAKPFNIGKTEITNSQYVEFLNAVAASDPYELFDSHMAWFPWNGVSRGGVDGSYTYGLIHSYYANKPVVYVGSGDAMRFANWLHNGQPRGAEDASTTEDGAYTLNGAMISSELAAVVRNPHAKWWLPSEDEWYKAAHYNPVASVYYDYSTGTNSVPNNNLPSADTGNSANFVVSSNYTTGSPDYPFTDAGAYTQSVSPYGTFDQGGNVSEWNETVFYSSPRYYRIIRGGSYQATSDSLHSAHWSWTSVLQGSQAYWGFRLASISALPGDFNHDGTVDAADYVVWRKTAGSPDNYNTWRANFGRTFFTGSGSGATANITVPEPATQTLMMFAAASWRIRRRRSA